MEDGGTLVEGMSPVGFGRVQKVTKARDSRPHIVARNHGVQLRDGAILIPQCLGSAFWIVGMCRSSLHSLLEAMQHDGHCKLSPPQLAP